MKEITPQTINTLWSKVPSVRNDFESSKHLYRAARNELNLAKNFRIQALAASITNAAAIKIHTTLTERKMKTKLVLQIHDELVLHAPNNEAEEAAKILQECMENNWVTQKLDIPMIAKPTICNNLSEAK
jgi:DNA polymerase-1